MRFTIYLLFTLSSSFLLLSCKQNEVPSYLSELDPLTVYPEKAAPNKSISVSEGISFIDYDKLLFGRIAGTAVTNSGNVFIGDWDANKIYVFDKYGVYLDEIGGEGSGPGEFRSIYYMKIFGNKLYAYDFNLRRLSLFSTEDHSLLSVQLMKFDGKKNSELSGRSSDSFHILDSQNFLIQFVPGLFDAPDDKRIQYLYIVSQNGKILSDKILELPWGKEFITDRVDPKFLVVPYARKALINVSNGFIYTLWTEDLAVKKIDLNGSFISAFYYPIRKEKLSRQELLSLKDFEDPHSQSMIKDAALPDTWPPISDFIIDDESRFWISVHTKETKTKAWWILNEQGELIARFNWPEDRAIRHVLNGNIYTLEDDQETGVDQIYRYGFVLN